MAHVISNLKQKSALFLFSILCMTMTAHHSFAGEGSPLWKKVGSWEVRVDTTLGNGCFAMASYKGGVFFRIGFNASEKEFGGYMLFGNPDWSSLEVGKEYSLTYKFDNEAPWKGDAFAFKFSEEDKITFLWQDFSDTNLFKEYMRKNKLRIDYNSKQIELLQLKGSYGAFEEVIKCQKVMNNTKRKSNGPKDPFAKQSNARNDPFAD